MAVDIIEDLNEAQRQAVLYGEGPLLVLAGAGSGKTRVLTCRVASLIQRGAAEAREITALTFTNKAAREMRERAARLSGGRLQGAFLGTFHRWALDVLRRWPKEAGLKPGFSILDSDDQRAVMNRLIKAEQLDPKEFPSRLVLGVISKEINRLHDLESYEAAAGSRRREIARLWKAYEARKQELSAVDFDDMLSRCLHLLQSKDVVLKAMQRRARYLLVDEFQDTNRVQMELLHTILGKAGNITAVGDEDQSIYRWRGAEMENILSFEKHFPGAEVIKLEENYRSTAPILSLSDALISRNVHRRGKRLFTKQEGGTPVRLYMAADDRDEAQWTVDEIERLMPEVPAGEIAVLLRTNAQTRPYEEELTRRNIPYRVVGGLRFWQRAEVKDALAYLRLVVHPDDAVAFERIINVPARGIGAATLDVLRKHAADTGLGLPAAARELPESLMARARMSLERFFKLLEEAEVTRQDVEAAEFSRWLLENSGLAALYEGQEEDKVVRRENLRQLVSAIAESEEQGLSLEEFLDTVALLEEGESGNGEDSLRLMTLHAAKGLEFEAVFIGGLEDQLLPHSNSSGDSAGIEEERRLLYVGMTRAKKRLALSAAAERFLFGQRKPTSPSRFLHDLDGGELERIAGAFSRRAPFSGGVTPANQRWRSHEATPSKSKDLAASHHASGRPRPGKKIGGAVLDDSGVSWRPGDRVCHRKFGKGIILACQGRGPRLKLVVFFDGAGKKTLVPTIAKLEKL